MGVYRFMCIATYIFSIILTLRYSIFIKSKNAIILIMTESYYFSDNLDQTVSQRESHKVFTLVAQIVIYLADYSRWADDWWRTQVEKALSKDQCHYRRIIRDIGKNIVKHVDIKAARLHGILGLAVTYPKQGKTRKQFTRIWGVWPCCDPGFSTQYFYWE